MIQTHLKKLFAGIHSVQFDHDCSHIVAMKSLEGEVVPLKEPIAISTDVEVSTCQSCISIYCTHQMGQFLWLDYIQFTGLLLVLVNFRFIVRKVLQLSTYVRAKFGRTNGSSMYICFLQIYIIL